MATTHSVFGEATTAIEVAAAFPSAIKDRTILITGVNEAGLGGTTTYSLAAHSPKLLILAGRTKLKVDEVIKFVQSQFPNVKTRFLQLDLSSQESCKQAAKEILDDASVKQIDLLINNAGVMAVPERTLSSDGIEIQLATNHIGHFLFTNVLMPKIIASAQSTSAPGITRIINVSSRGVLYSPFRFHDWNFEKKEDQLPEEERPLAAKIKATGRNYDPHVVYDGLVAYAQSKTANVLFTVGLNTHLYKKYGILSLSLHPGAIATELGRHIFPDGYTAEVTEYYEKRGFTFKTKEAGASTSLVAALDPVLSGVGSGSDHVYLSDCQVVEWCPDYATDPKLADKLWQLSAGIVNESFVY